MMKDKRVSIKIEVLEEGKMEVGLHGNLLDLVLSMTQVLDTLFDDNNISKNDGRSIVMDALAHHAEGNQRTKTTVNTILQ